MEGNYKASCLRGHVFQRRWAALGLFHGRRLLPMLISAKCWCGEIFFGSKNISHPSFINIFCDCYPFWVKGRWSAYIAFLPTIMINFHPRQDIQLFYQYRDHLPGGEPTISTFLHQKKTPRAPNVGRLGGKEGPAGSSGVHLQTALYVIGS